ncbi:SDR family NAD(P)-dependent oxidoreductase [Flavobacterium sinopsychrotolerans]|uniref:NAD(P)-dependent dehydrogenase, short-chain alcohol dehydrogenase family n=1 Tax=Flavobacterium sinopsychrotolerans TaxID=604089 RepID=A0A1H8MRC0_9FLAO|nr:SDR family oxidoreductase [Flavobacterium sinopsychrotolerans]SEO19800.1 NAD(P)-dependent dehydrogenase, short-chain alcohol dehydrogenase family [Flavobacterium sinopsychrotolerans]
MKKLENKVAIITGGAGSIGETTAKLFLEEGAKVMLVDLNEEILKETIEKLNDKNVKYCVADVSKSIDVANYVNETVKAYGKIDVFFNNAGIEGIVKPIADYPEEIFDKVIAVNVKGTWLGNKYVLPQMNDGGSIIMTSSVAGINGSPNVSAYITSKHAVVGIMRATAVEGATRKIRVNTVHPSPVDNRMMRSLEEGFSAGHAAEVKKNLEATIPLGRYAEPIEIAKLVVFLASDDSQFITGTTQVIDGGLSVQ